jgi:membrane protein implicated in regulation of membrane protease activity
VLVIATGALLTVVLREGIGVRRRRVRTGPEGLIGQIGVVRSWGDPEPTGRVLVGGALWRARRSWHDGDEGELHEGDAIVVERLSGLTLSVRRAEDWELAP